MITGINSTAMFNFSFELNKKIRAFEQHHNKIFGKILLSEEFLKKVRIKVLEEFIYFNENIKPIDCILLKFSQKKKEVISKIIKPIKEKIISVTDLVIIGNSRVLRI